ncbi:OLC1v1008097C1 [Oldenlandia corymbosa var. corymbosa]|uniref:OLC1v1008097C1 n=1 Tax=Oldenlandia corymbosa var. corymbosa TaxID=529605 RepID=A0AAV1DP16_OLDCO|nr:OLC1v1008097C1 [Oldenlandia corymbosa var. corymbosa]
MAEKKKRKVMDVTTNTLKLGRFLMARKTKRKVLLDHKTKKKLRRPTRVRKMENIIRVPDDVIMKILVLLPAKSLMRFKSVCKQWKTMVSDPWFAKAHYEQSKGIPEASCLWLHFKTNSSSTISQAIYPAKSVDGTYSTRLQTYNFVRDCFPCSSIVNGMLCLYEQKYKDYQLHFLNLTSGEMISLPKPLSLLGSWLIPKQCRFHILCEDHKFKLLFIERESRRSRGGMMIFAFGTKEWRKLTCTLENLGKKALHVNGKVYWQDKIKDQNNNGQMIVKYFDFHEENVFLLETPELGVDERWDLGGIGNDVGLVCRKSCIPCVFKMWRYESEIHQWMKYEVNLGKESIWNVQFIGGTSKSSEILITGQKSRYDRALQCVCYDFETRKCSRPPFEIFYPESSRLCYHDCGRPVSYHIENILPLESLGKRKKLEEYAEKAIKKRRVLW